jgi:hypothetical protein
MLKKNATRMFLVAALAAGALALTSAPTFADHGTAGGRFFGAELNGKNEVDGGDPDGTGDAIITLRPGVSKVCFDIEVENIAAPSLAHIHAGKKGKNGPVVVDFNIAQNGLKNCVKADPAVIAKIRSKPGDYYVNVHNDEFPGGAVRGQLEK